MSIIAAKPPKDRIGKNLHCTFARVALGVSVVVYPLLLLFYQHANSSTFDEGMHIAAGYRYWQCGDYGINPEHPPLLKLIAAIPVRSWAFDDFDAPCGKAITGNARLIAAGYRLLNGPSGDAALSGGRAAVILFPILLLVTVWFAARVWFGWLAAGLAAILTVFEPNLTAHGALITTDMAITATTLLAVFCADRFLRKTSFVRFFLMSLALGLALASKHTAVFVPFILLLQFAASFLGNRASRTGGDGARLLLAWCAACLIAVAILWGTYQFRYSALPDRNAPSFEINKMLDDAGLSQSLLGRTVKTAARFHLLPESYLAGLAYVAGNSTRASFIFGKQYGTGVWFYFPVTVLVKTPLTILLFVAFALTSRLMWRERGREFVILAIPIAVFLLSAMSSKINLGVRHILPIYPFLILFAAAAAANLFQRSRGAQFVCVALVAFQAASYVHAFPNEIAYANEAFGGPRDVRRVLGDSNVDWAQGLYQAKKYADARGITDCWIAWAGPKEPAGVGLPCRSLAGPSFVEAAHPDLPPLVPEKFSGTIFVSNILTNYDIFPYSHFLRQPPDDVIAGSVLVYHGEFDLPEIAAERRVARGWWYLYHNQGPQAVQEFAAAEPHAAAPGILHALYGWALEASGRPAEAREKYALAAEDYTGKPAYAHARRAALERVRALSPALPSK